MLVSEKKISIFFSLIMNTLNRVVHSESPFYGTLIF